MQSSWSGEHIAQLASVSPIRTHPQAWDVTDFTTSVGRSLQRHGPDARACAAQDHSVEEIGPDEAADEESLRPRSE